MRCCAAPLSWQCHSHFGVGILSDLTHINSICLLMSGHAGSCPVFTGHQTCSCFRPLNSTAKLRQVQHLLPYNMGIRQVYIYYCISMSIGSPLPCQLAVMKWTQCGSYLNERSCLECWQPSAQSELNAPGPGSRVRWGSAKAEHEIKRQTEAQPWVWSDECSQERNHGSPFHH